MSFLDMFTPKQSGAYDGFQLDPALKQYMQQQRMREFFDRIGQVGQGMIEAGSRGADFLPALAMGVSRASGYGRGRGPGRGGSGLLDVLDMQRGIDKIRSRQEKRRKETEYQDLISGGSGLGADGIDWNAPRPGNPDLTKGMSSAQRGLLSSLSREEGLEVLKKQAFPAPAAYNSPTTVMGPDGNLQLVRFPQKLGAPVPVEGYRPKPDGGLTEAQRAHNAEIAQARATLEQMGLDKAEITRRTQKATNTGRDNPDYDPGLERVMRTATDRMVGDDSDYEMYHRRYLGPAPEFSDPAGPKQLPPGVSAVPPGLWQQTQDFLFGPGSSAGQPARQGNGATPPAASQRRRGRRRGGRGQAAASQPGPAKAIETMSEDEVMALIYGDRQLAQDEINRLSARLDQLGVGQQGR